jgi:hypothetical protein
MTPQGTEKGFTDSLSNCGICEEADKLGAGLPGADARENGPNDKWQAHPSNAPT